MEFSTSCLCYNCVLIKTLKDKNAVKNTTFNRDLCGSKNFFLCLTVLWATPSAMLVLSRTKCSGMPVGLFPSSNHFKQRDSDDRFFYLKPLQKL
jgi:hypothetical protein